MEDSYPGCVFKYEESRAGYKILKAIVKYDE